MTTGLKHRTEERVGERRKNPRRPALHGSKPATLGSGVLETRAAVADVGQPSGAGRGASNRLKAG